MSTVANYFGSGATLSGSTLTINLAPLATAFGFNAATYKASQALALIIMQATSTSVGKTDDATWGAIVERGFDSLVTRGTSNQIAYGYSVNLYAPNTATTLDPDNVV